MEKIATFYFFHTAIIKTLKTAEQQFTNTMMTQAVIDMHRILKLTHKFCILLADTIYYTGSLLHVNRLRRNLAFLHRNLQLLQN